MAILNFSDVLIKVGLDPTRVKLIRHSLAADDLRGHRTGHRAVGEQAFQRAQPLHGGKA